ncbi:MAG: methyltransferase-like protein [Gammaproteobacteria bacterium]|nr:MAG: methyltransferase-like protein [Gammaproteobacteria bacterium]TND01421.1 MAG: methyltransferase-like protein [Gammaproteobacteria bacterium]
MFYGLNNDELKLLDQALDTINKLYPRIFAGDHLITVGRCMAFLDDQKFMAAYNKNVRNRQERSLLWRLHTLAWAGRHCSRLPGSFVECGVYKGFCSAVLTDYLDFSTAQASRSYYLYDTFEGIPVDHLEGSPVDKDSYKEADLYEQVCERFRPHPNVRVIKGRVPDVFSVQEVPDQIAFLHIDMNSATAEIGALEVLFERVVPGGMIIFDDYGWQAYRAQKDQENAFMDARDYSILELPTGQGLVVKREA